MFYRVNYLGDFMADGGEGFGGRREGVARLRGNRRWPDSDNGDAAVAIWCGSVRAD
tara:strand:- start:2179 stop:2346 length:168 start_codon:yes stop_codon:yes gene_type:complete